jgi:hypothetical protein
LEAIGKLADGIAGLLSAFMKIVQDNMKKVADTISRAHEASTMLNDGKGLNEHSNWPDPVRV